MITQTGMLVHAVSSSVDRVEPEEYSTLLDVDSLERGKAETNYVTQTNETLR